MDPVQTQLPPMTLEELRVLAGSTYQPRLVLEYVTNFVVSSLTLNFSSTKLNYSISPGFSSSQGL